LGTKEHGWAQENHAKFTRARAARDEVTVAPWTAAMLDHLDLKKARWRISPISGTINENWLSAFAPSQV